MIEFTKSEIDDINFIAKVQTLTNEVIKDFLPQEIFLFKIDNWFDSKWLNFTSKALGAIGICHYNEDSRIPPFNPSRIIEESHFKQNKFKTYTPVLVEQEIHKVQASEQNRHRKIIDLSPSALFVWYSSNTLSNGHGSLMIYRVEEEECMTFYVAFRKNKEWDIVNTPGSNEKMIELYLDRSKRNS